MDWLLIGKLFLILFLIIGNAFFVGSEIALTSARRSRIKQLASTGNKSAKIVQLLHKEPERFYSVTQVGITLVSLALGAIGMVTLTQIMDPGIISAFSMLGQSEKILSWASTFSYIVAFIIISFLHVVAGELAPKVLAFHKAEAMSLAVARTINGMHALLRPLLWVMNHASNGLLRMFGQGDLAEHGEGHFSMTAEEIRTILSAGEKDSALDPQLSMMLRGVFDLDDHTARDAMIPRTEVEGVPKTATVADVLNLFREKQLERYPVYETSLDNVVGIVSMKELLNRLAMQGNQESTGKLLKLRVSEVMMQAYFVPDTMPLSHLLKDFTSNRRQLAIVLDEYGGTEGLITLEDILEEIVGDYEDEFTPRHRHIKMEDMQHFKINGGVRVTELEPKLNFPFPTGDYVTLGGLIHHSLGRIAVVGDLVQLEGACLRVLEMDKHRITKVLFKYQTNETESCETISATKGDDKATTPSQPQPTATMPKNTNETPSKPAPNAPEKKPEDAMQVSETARDKKSPNSGAAASSSGGATLQPQLTATKPKNTKETPDKPAFKALEKKPEDGK